MPHALVSPVDQVALMLVGDQLVSADGSQRYNIVDGIAQLIRSENLARAENFAASYAAVRLAEGRGSEESSYYRALPYSDLTGNFPDQWRVRARSFDLLVDEVGADPLDIVDAGAGSCWLAARLAGLGHSVMAIDINSDSSDGLGAREHYEAVFQVARAELQAMPLANSSADVVIYNASAHYLELGDLVREATRVLRPGGRIVIADSPVYVDAVAGAAMAAEMIDYIRGLGVEPAEHPGSGFFTDELLAESALEWRVVSDGRRSRRLRRKIAGLRAGREIARMPLLIAMNPWPAT